MATNFPTSLDSLTNPTASDKLNSASVPHATQHATLNDAVEALEAKVGINSSAVTTSHDYLIDKQSVVPYDDSSARTTAVPSPVEGQMSYLKDTNSVEVYDGSSWAAVAGGKILQVLSTTKTDTFTSTSTTFTAITGLSQAITPSSATSKVLVIANLKGASDEATAGCTFNYRLMRDSTPIGIGDAAGSRDQTTGSLGTRAIGTDFVLMADTAVLLDSPATTSSTTYSVQGRTNSAGTFYLNRTADDTDSAVLPRSISSITVMEVSA